MLILVLLQRVIISLLPFILTFLTSTLTIIYPFIATHLTHTNPQLTFYTAPPSTPSRYINQPMSSRSTTRSFVNLTSPWQSTRRDHHLTLIPILIDLESLVFCARQPTRFNP